MYFNEEKNPFFFSVYYFFGGFGGFGKGFIYRLYARKKPPPCDTTGGQYPSRGSAGGIIPPSHSYFSTVFAAVVVSLRRNMRKAPASDQWATGAVSMRRSDQRSLVQTLGRWGHASFFHPSPLKTLGIGALYQQYPAIKSQRRLRMK